MPKLTMRSLLVVSLCLAFVIVVAAQSQCEKLAGEIWMSVAANCTDTGRNQVCYGNYVIDSTGRTPDYQFEAVGDIVAVDAVERLSLSTYNFDNDTWGIALMRLQANLPDTLPGQNITLLAFGEVMIENQVDTESSPLLVTLTANGRMRSTPNATSNANILTMIPSSTQLEAIGRDESGTWVYTQYGDAAGWLSTQVLQVNGDINSLNQFADQPTFAAPMQIVYLSTGISHSSCEAVPDNGILIQTPQGAGQLTVTINGVNISMGSTLFITSTEATLRIFVLEGTVIVTAMDVAQVVPAGTLVNVPLNENGTLPLGIPSVPQPYNSANVSGLPLEILSSGETLIFDAVEVSAPLSTAEIDAAISDYMSDIGLEAGIYTITRVEATIRNGSGNCPPDVTFTRQHDGNPDILFNEYSRLSNGAYGDNDTALDAARNSDSSYIGEANQLRLTSPTTLTWFSISNGNGSPAYCEFRYTGVRTG